MSEPGRLSVDSDCEMERQLLRAGRAEAPVGARHRAVVAAAAALGTTGMAAGAAASGVAGKAGTAVSAKWLAAMGLVGVGAVAAVAANESRHSVTGTHGASEALGVDVSLRPPVPTARPLPAPIPLPSASAIATASASASASVSEPVPTASSAPRGVAVAPVEPASPSDDMHTQLQTLEEARRALAAGDPAQALSVLDTYATTFPRASMAPEATVIRIDALVRAGDRPAAQRVGEAFLASHPQSPYAQHVRSLVGLPNP